LQTEETAMMQTDTENHYS